jgi:hypothetical protein
MVKNIENRENQVQEVMKKTLIYILLSLSSFAATAKEFSVNCINSSGNEFSYTFNDVKRTVTMSGVEARANFYENEIIFKIFGWFHTLNRNTGYMSASDDKDTTQMKCSLVTKKIF